MGKQVFSNLSVFESVLKRGLGGASGVDGVGRPCPPVRNDIVTPRHLFEKQFPYLDSTLFVTLA